VADVRHTAEDVTADAALKIRRHPLKAIRLAACSGSAAGALIAFSLGWWTQSRQ
jgi:hypothetical protein